MSHTARGACLVGVLFVCGGLAVLAPSRAVAAEDADTIAKITKLNKKAIEEYENLNFEEARKLLKEALDLCSQAGLDKHPIKARTHIHLGIVILAGFKQREVALKQFRRALDIQSDIKLTKILANPEIQEAFDEAVAGGGTDRGAEGAAPAGGAAAGAAGPPGLTHQPVSQGVQGGAVAVTITVDPSVGAEKAVLFYRPDGAAEFLSREMKSSAAGTYAADIPDSATGGNLVAYYIEAQGADGQAKASRGTAADPIVVSLRGAGAPDEEATKDEDEDEDEEEGGEGGKLYFSLLLGSGVGWTSGHGEVNVDHTIKPAGFAPSQLGHLAPEVGYFLKPDLMLSLQGRFQLVTGATPESVPRIPENAKMCGGDYVCQPAGGALAVFARATWFLGGEKLRPFVSFGVGAGYIRHVATFAAVKLCGPLMNTTCVDTVPAGPVLVGPGGGIIYNLSPAFGLVLGINAPLGFPKFTFHIDVNGGLALRL